MRSVANVVQTVIKTLRQMALYTKGSVQFDYDEFWRRLGAENFTKQQCGPLDLRLDLLESFIDGNSEDDGLSKKSTRSTNHNARKPRKVKKLSNQGAEIFISAAGELNIVVLTDPVIDSDSACVLFDICLTIFLEKTKCGKVIGLDEAHNSIYLSYCTIVNMH